MEISFFFLSFFFFFARDYVIVGTHHSHWCITLRELVKFLWDKKTVNLCSAVLIVLAELSDLLIVGGMCMYVNHRNHYYM